MGYLKKIFLIGLTITAFISCNNPMDYLYSIIRRMQFIPYPTPLEFAGTGTLVGGGPNRLTLVAPPDTCFPEKILVIDPNTGTEVEQKTNLRRVDNTQVAKQQYHFSMSGQGALRFMNFVGAGNPTIRVGGNFDIVKKIEVDMKGVQIEYFDSIKMMEFYRTYLNESCKDYLDHVAVISQALRVDEMVFKFYKDNGGRVFFDINNIEQFVDIQGDIKFSIEQNYILHITSPKYIGYQLSALRRQDNGLSLYRATKVKWGKFQFRSIQLFDDLAIENTQEQLPELVQYLPIPTNSNYPNFDNFIFIDDHSQFIDTSDENESK